MWLWRHLSKVHVTHQSVFSHQSLLLIHFFVVSSHCIQTILSFWRVYERSQTVEQFNVFFILHWQLTNTSIIPLEEQMGEQGRPLVCTLASKEQKLQLQIIQQHGWVQLSCGNMHCELFVQPFAANHQQETRGARVRNVQTVSTDTEHLIQTFTSHERSPKAPALM